MNPSDDALTSSIIATAGRDAGKQFTMLEIDPLIKAGYILRFNSALRVESFQALLNEWHECAERGEPPVDLVMRTLRDSDPTVVHTLLTELLDYVRISPDPQHPGVNRKLLPNDIREMKTLLNDVLPALVKLNFFSEA